MAKSAGADIHKRTLEDCDEKTKTFGEVVRHIAESVYGETILWATCTSPLVFPKDYREAIAAYYPALEQGCDSLMSVESFKRYIRNEEELINYGLGLKHVPSQQLPTFYFVTDGVLMAPRLKMIEWAYFHGKHPYKFLVNKRTGCDIDDGLDLACARAWLDMGESV